MIAIGAVALVVGSASGAPTVTSATAVRYTAPYSGEEEGNIFEGFSGCGVAASVPSEPFFNLTTGLGYGKVKETARSCGSTASSTYADVAPELLSSGLPPTSGLHHLRANWKLTFSVNLSANPANATQQASAGLFVVVEIGLLDMTTGKAIYRDVLPTTLEETISSGSFSQTYSNVRESVYLNTTLNGTNQYTFETDFEVGIYLSVSPGSSTASGLVNMSSGLKAADLVSVVFR
jgi:hypothetical protein